VVIVGSFGGGVEGREEKRLRPGSDDAVTMAMKEQMLLYLHITTICSSV
jgi:hypothetical protein